MGIAGQTVLLTRATGSIGQAVARELSRDYAPDGIRVNAVALGEVCTPMLRPSPR